MKELIKKNAYYYIGVLVLMIAGGIALLAYSKAEITMWVNTHHSVFLDSLFYQINPVGDLFFSVAIFLIIGIVKDWKLASKALICFLAAAIVTQFMKHIVFPGELRPTLYFPLNFPDFKLRLLEGVVQLQTESFPSGHTTAAFAIATFLALYMKNKYWNCLLLLAGFLVGYGRVYLSQHFTTDVYAGMIIGVIVPTFVYCYYPKRWESR